MTPTRRTVLATTAAATSFTAGRLGSTLTGMNEPPDERELTNVTTTVPENAPIAVDATILLRFINPARTAEFDLRITWHGEEPVRYRFGSTLPFGGSEIQR